MIGHRRPTTRRLPDGSTWLSPKRGALSSIRIGHGGLAMRRVPDGRTRLSAAQRASSSIVTGYGGPKMRCLPDTRLPDGCTPHGRTWVSPPGRSLAVRIRGLGAFALLCVLGTAYPVVAQQPAGTAPTADPSQLLAEAERHFAEGTRLAGEQRAAEAQEQFRAALLRYEAAASALGVGNGYLLYNIGNAYFRLGDIGRAVLHYREAQQYIPSDPNLQQSLRHVRSLRRDRIEPSATGGVVRLLFFWHFTMPLRVRAALLLSAWNLLWLLALLPAVATLDERARGLRERLHAWRTWQRVRRQVTGAVVAVGVVVAVAMGGSVAVELVDSQAAAAVVVAPEVVARRGDGAAYEPSFDSALHAGTELTVIEQRNEWYQVALADGRRAWLPEHAVAVVGETASRAHKSLPF